MFALLLALGCWRPDAYVPPAAPPPGDDEPAAAPEEGAAQAEGSAEEPEGAAEDGEGVPEGEGAAEPEEDEAAPPFPAYTGRTLQAPVTIVDDYGKPLAVLGVPGFEVEVRGEEAIRVRVWCAACAPPVEGWIQAHLVERVGATPTGGSK